MQTNVSRFLLNYRSTPNATTGRTPSELFLKRNIRTRLDLLKPNVPEIVTQNQSKQKYHHDKKSQMRSFKIGEHVLAQNFRGTPKWLPGVVVGKAGNVSYQVKVGHQIWSRHIDQLLRREADLQIPNNESPIDSTTFPSGVSIGPQGASRSDNPEANHDLNTDTSAILPEEPRDSQSANATSIPEEPRYPQRQRKEHDRFTPGVN